MWRDTKWAVLLVLVTSISCNLFSSEDSTPEIPGKLVYSAPDKNGRYQIYTSLTNGSKRKQLTSSGDEEAEFFNPAWNSDGTQIALTSTLNSSSEGPSLYLMNSDGSNLRPLKGRSNTDIVTTGNNPKWSPDDSKIAFDSCLNFELGGRNHELFVYDFETDIITQLTDTLSEDENPVWNPLNSEIAFSSSRASESFNVSDIYILNLQNMAVQRLTNTDNSGRQLWFANGNELLFWSNNELFKYDFRFGLATKLPVNLSSNIGFRPLSLSFENEYVLLITFNLVDSHKEHKLQILDIRTGDIHEGISSSRFNGADLFD
ncbi:MAG: hypothetical protein ABJ387_04870 [Balneola sp.]